MQSPRESTGSDGRQPVVRSLLRGGKGQGTLEYAIVAFAFLGIVVGLGALWHLFDAGVLVRHAIQSASHHIQQAAPGAFADVFMY